MRRGRLGFPFCARGHAEARDKQVVIDGAHGKGRGRRRSQIEGNDPTNLEKGCARS